MWEREIKNSGHDDEKRRTKVVFYSFRNDKGDSGGVVFCGFFVCLLLATNDDGRYGHEGGGARELRDMEEGGWRGGALRTGSQDL